MPTIILLWSALKKASVPSRDRDSITVFDIKSDMVPSHSAEFGSKQCYVPRTYRAGFFEDCRLLRVFTENSYFGHSFHKPDILFWAKIYPILDKHASYFRQKQSAFAVAKSCSFSTWRGAGASCCFGTQAWCYHSRLHAIY